MGKIVSIVSSPVVKGTSDTIVNKIVAGAIGMSTNMIYQYHTAEFDAKGCLACMKCKKTGKCVQNDRITEMIEHIRTADCLILSTPVFFENVSWSFKITMDRMFSLLDSNGKSTIPEGKEIIIVVTYKGSEDSGLGVESYVRKFMIDRFKCKHIGSIVVPYEMGTDSYHLGDDLTKASYTYGNMFSISVPLNSYVESLDESDPRRGIYTFPKGHIWTGTDDDLKLIGNDTDTRMNS